MPPHPDPLTDPSPAAEAAGRPGRRRRAGYRAAAGAVVAAPILAGVVYAAICAFVALRFTRPPRLPFRRTPADLGLPFETVTFPSRVDRIRLEGWLLPSVAGAGPRRPVIFVHGRGNDRQGEAGGRVLEIAAALVRAGHAVLLFDLRGSGRSDGTRYTFGLREVRDVGGAVDFLMERGLAPDGVGLLGFSMGGATALLLAAGEPCVRAVATDCAYADLATLLRDQVPKKTRLPRLFTPGTVFMARPLVGIKASAIRPIDSVPALAARNVPLLLIHGAADATVPVVHAERLAAAYGPGVQTLIVPDAGHVAAYATDPGTYLERLLAFVA